LLHVHRADPAGQVRLHLVLVAGVGVDDEPLPRPVVRARLPGPGLLLFAGLFAFLALDVLVVGVEQVGVGRQVAGLLDRLAFGQGTFFSSPRTSRRNSLAVVRSRCGGGGAGRRRSAGAGVSPPWRFIWRLVCRFTAASVRSEPVEQGRRESNPQPPVLETGAL